MEASFDEELRRVGKTMVRDEACVVSVYKEDSLPAQPWYYVFQVKKVEEL